MSEEVLKNSSTTNLSRVTYSPRAARKTKPKQNVTAVIARLLIYCDQAQVLPTRVSFRRTDYIGQGTFGVVHNVKISKLQVLSDQTLPDCCMIVKARDSLVVKSLQVKSRRNKELAILKLIPFHPNISNLMMFYFSGQGENLQLNLFFEKMQMTLADLLITRGSLSEQTTLRYGSNIFEALCLLHSLLICHRDIKPRNLLVDIKKDVLKLCDFGSAKKLVDGERSISYMCSRYYRPPELILGSENYSCKVDIWSAGCVMFEMATKKPLFPGESSIDQLSEIASVLGPPTKEELTEMNCQDLPITTLLITTTRERESFHESIQPKMGLYLWNETRLLRNLLSHVIRYSPDVRLSAKEALSYIKDNLE